MSCERCKKARYAVQIWFYEISGLRAIHDRIWEYMQIQDGRALKSTNKMVVLSRQVGKANQTLQSDYVKIGDAIDILERRILELENPGDLRLTIIEPHKSN